MPLFQISATFPTPILEDFQVFLNYFLKKKIKLTASGFLSGTACYELNSLMSDPQQDVSTRTRHYFYPKLYLFYSLASNGQILNTQRKGKSVWVQPDFDRVEAFFDLSDTEQYIALLEILWTRADWESLNDPDSRRSPANTVHHFFSVIVSYSSKGRKLTEEELRHWTYDLWPFLEYLEYFGLWEAVFKPYKDYRRMVEVAEFMPTKFGVELAKVFTAERPVGIWNKLELFDGSGIFSLVSFKNDELKFDEETIEAKIVQSQNEAFLSAFQHLFPKGELEKSLSFSEPKSRKGDHIFHVRFKHYPKVWRRVRMPAKDSLHKLHIEIIRAIGFDSDHLYAFYPDNKLYSRISYNSPWGGEGPFADEIKIGDLAVDVGAQFLYLFDFGASWEFEIVLEKVDSEASPSKIPSLIESHGEAPEQYPNYDEDDW